MSQLEHIEAIEKRLWSAADNLRANSNYASNEYFLPVMGLVGAKGCVALFFATLPNNKFGASGAELEQHNQPVLIHSRSQR